MSSRKFTRRSLLGQAAALAGTSFFTGCGSPGGESGSLDAVWGQPGKTEGKLQKPRAITIDKHDHLYIVDITPRISVFTPDGEYLRGWQTPQFADGKPSGLSFSRDGNLLVADTHYARILCYTPEGKLLENRTIGGTKGEKPGEFSCVTDCLEDSVGNYYVSEYGEWDRIQKFTPQRKYLSQWGGHGSEKGKFLRPQKMAIDDRDQIWVTDACNHRVQVFDVRGSEPKLVMVWGEFGVAPGKLRYPYDILLDGQGHVYLCEFGNHRVQKFTLDGDLIGWWGKNGRKGGELDQPWGITRDSQGRMYVLDSYNHRVQRFWL
jgi:NHL repeat